MNTDVKFRLWKNLMESFGDHLGAFIGNSNVGNALAPYLKDMSSWSREATAIAGSTLIQVPEGIANFIGRAVGKDSTKVRTILNEGFDQALHTLTQRVGVAQKTDPAYQPTDTDIQQAVKEALRTGSLVKLNPADGEVNANPSEMVFHEADCCTCMQNVSSGGGKGKSAPTTTTKLRDGFKKMKLIEALRGGYLPTRSACCGVALSNTVRDIHEAPRPFREVLAALGQTYTDWYANLLKKANPDEQKVMMSAETRSCTPQEVRGLYVLANTPSDYIARLPKPKPSAAQQFGSTARGFIDETKKIVTVVSDTMLDPKLQRWCGVNARLHNRNANKKLRKADALNAGLFGKK